MVTTQIRLVIYAHADKPARTTSICETHKFSTFMDVQESIFQLREKKNAN